MSRIAALSCAVFLSSCDTSGICPHLKAERDACVGTYAISDATLQRCDSSFFGVCTDEEQLALVRHRQCLADQGLSSCPDDALTITSAGQLGDALVACSFEIADLTPPCSLEAASWYPY